MDETLALSIEVDYRIEFDKLAILRQSILSDVWLKYAARFSAIITMV